MKKVIMEFIGTFFLVLTIGLTALSPEVGLFAPLTIGAVLIVMVYTGGPISGAHYNPAVTLAIYLSKKCTLKEVPYYIIAQLMGAILATYIVLFLTGTTESVVTLTFLPAFISEVLFTFALVFVILNVGFSNRSKGNAYYGIAIGLTVVAGIYAVGDISGGVFNPAVAISLIGMGITDLSTLGLYVGSQFIASVVAWKVFQIIEMKEAS